MFTNSMSPEMNGSGRGAQQRSAQSRVYFEFHKIESVLPRVELEDPEADPAEQNC